MSKRAKPRHFKSGSFSEQTYQTTLQLRRRPPTYSLFPTTFCSVLCYYLLTIWGYRSRQPIKTHEGSVAPVLRLHMKSNLFADRSHHKTAGSCQFSWHSSSEKVLEFIRVQELASCLLCNPLDQYYFQTSYSEPLCPE